MTLARFLALALLLGGCGGSQKDPARPAGGEEVKPASTQDPFEGKWVPVEKNCDGAARVLDSSESYRFEQGFFVETRVFSEGSDHQTLDGYIFTRVVSSSTSTTEEGVLRAESLKRVHRDKINGVVVDPPVYERVTSLTIKDRAYSVRLEGEKLFVVLRDHDACELGGDLSLVLTRPQRR